MVRCGEEDKREASLAVLRDLAVAPEHCSAIVQYGGIPALVDVMSSAGLSQAATYAASCLRSLALQEHWAREVGFTKGILQPFTPPQISKMPSNSPCSTFCEQQRIDLTQSPLVLRPY